MLLSVRNLEIGRTAPLQPPLSLEIGAGEVVAVIGPNGSGKTTLFHTLIGLLAPLGGQFGLHERPGVLFQDRALPLNVSSQRWISHLARLWNVPINSPLLSTLGVESGSKPIRRLSGGAQQKLALYGALHHEPQFVILDEPTSNLDTPSREALYELISERRKRGTSFLISSHHASDIAALQPRIVTFSAKSGARHQALVSFSGSTSLAQLSLPVTSEQTAAGLLLSSELPIDFLEIATQIAHANQVSIVTFQVLS